MRTEHRLSLAGMRWLVLAALLTAPASGCRSGPPSRPVAAAEPGLTSPDESGTAVAAVPPPRTLSWVDRHPLLYKPRDYYESSGNNTIVKATAATLVGIPVGVFGELRQIVVGVPAQPRY